MMMKRLAATALSGVLLVGALAGCTNKTDKDMPGPSPDPTESVQPSATPAAAATAVETEDVSQKLLGIPRDADAFTVDGVAVSMEDYLYWLCYVLDSVSYNVGGAENIPWDETESGVTFTEYAKENARDMAKLYQAVANNAASNSVVLTDEDKSDLDIQIAGTITQAGGEEGYANTLQQVCRSDAGLRNMFTISYLYSGLQAKLFPAEEATDEVLDAWCEEQGKMMVKHILIKTVGDDRQELSAEDQEAARVKAQGLLDQLRASDDAAALFDTLMNENSEDGRDANTGALYSPDGYFFGPGEMVQEFEEASKALQVGEISDLVKSSYGYHIILRLPIDRTQAAAAWQTANSEALQTQMDEQVTAWMEEAVVETGENYDAVDPKAFYEKLTAYRNELDGVDESADPSTAPAAPEATPETTPAGE